MSSAVNELCTPVARRFHRGPNARLSIARTRAVRKIACVEVGEPVPHARRLARGYWPASVSRPRRDGGRRGRQTQRPSSVAA